MQHSQNLKGKRKTELKESQQLFEKFIKSQSYQTLISSFFRFSLLSLSILKYIKYLLMPQTFKLNKEKQKKSLFYKEKSLVGLTPGK